MVLIISIDGDASVNAVIDWLDAFDLGFFRTSVGESLQGDFAYTFCSELASHDFERFPIQDVRFVWYRRFSPLDISFTKKLTDDAIRAYMMQHAGSEADGVTQEMFRSLQGKPFLSSPETSNISKLRQLKVASDLDFNIPATIVTNSKTKLRAFFDSHPNMVVKSVQDLLRVETSEGAFRSFTKLVTDEFLNELPEKIFPCLAQEYIEKEVELRVFYLDGKSYAMAIFSQSNDQTKIDYRNYLRERGNRRVPFRLPESLQEKIVRLMEALELKTGSLDLIYTPEGEYYFLEVNPVGQFGMVSNPCNYRLEKEIAQFIKKNEKVQPAEST